MLTKSATYINNRTKSRDERLIPAAITDTGCERELNEDRYAVIECSVGTIWVLCDGMGGAMGGELAAQLAIDVIKRQLESVNYNSLTAAVEGAVQEANRVIVLRRQNPAFAGMGTTIVVAGINDKELVIASVGDSRAYVVRDAAISQITTDHTYVQDLVDQGKIKADEALGHPQAHVLTRCLGSEPGVKIDLMRYSIEGSNEEEAGDYLILCTDGLYSLVTENEIANITTNNPPCNACVKLVELAKSRGGYDNITLAIIPICGQIIEQGSYDEEELRVESEVAYITDPPRKRYIKLIGLSMLAGLIFCTALIVVSLYVF